jgi:hypothetical protein
MSLLEEMCVSLTEGSTISFSPVMEGWEVCGLQPSDPLIEALGPHIVSATVMIKEYMNPLTQGSALDREQGSTTEELRLNALTTECLIYPFLELVPNHEDGNILEVGTPVRLVYTVEGIGEAEDKKEFVLLESTVAFAVQL